MKFLILFIALMLALIASDTVPATHSSASVTGHSVTPPPAAATTTQNTPHSTDNHVSKPGKSSHGHKNHDCQHKHTKTQFSGPQLMIKKFLDHKSVSVTVRTGKNSFKFFSFISKNSRGILLDLNSKVNALADPTKFLADAVTIGKDGALTQALTDFRLIKGCKFRNPNKELEFSFRSESKSNPKPFDITIRFHDVPRTELLVNDLKEFDDVMFHLERSCHSRKNQLRNRKSWFISKADEVFENVKKLRNGRSNQQRLMGPNSPFNIDNRIAIEKAKQKKATLALVKAKKEAKKEAQYLADLDYKIDQAKTDFGEASKIRELTKTELEAAKFEREKDEISFTDAKNSLIRSIPQARKKIEKAVERAHDKEHELETVDLKIHS